MQKLALSKGARRIEAHSTIARVSAFSFRLRNSYFEQKSFFFIFHYPLSINL